MKWKPVRTAPRDGTPILLGWKYEKFHPLVGHFEGDDCGVLTKDMGFELFDIKPTHWMALSDLPPL